ncbi:MAG: hypothetical protein ACLPKE_13350 [Streptosporangiaceae bacterium]
MVGADRADQQSRSADSRAAASVIVIGIANDASLHVRFVPEPENPSRRPDPAPAGIAPSGRRR